MTAPDDPHRAILRRVARMPTEQLPPGPQPFTGCDYCDERVPDWPKAQRAHAKQHKREQVAAKKQQQKQKQRDDTARLRAINREKKLNAKLARAIPPDAPSGRGWETDADARDVASRKPVKPGEQLGLLP